MTTVQNIKEKLKIFRPTSQEVNLFDPNLNDKSTRLFKLKDDQNNKFKIWVFTATFKLEMPLKTCLLFSINIPDKICLANKRLKNAGGLETVFTDNSNDERVKSCIELLNIDLKSLLLDKTEGLSVYRNSLQLILRHDRQLIQEIKICKKLKSLIETNFPDKDNKSDYSDLPIELKQILLKYETLAITDDFERDELIEGLSTKQRNNLIKAIEPKLEAINSFLDTFGDKPLTEGAIGLQCLAELTIELTNDEKKNHN